MEAAIEIKDDENGVLNVGILDFLLDDSLI